MANSANPATTKPTQPEESKDSLREIAETVVFVIVLVLLLKLFVAEAFVIPTGSMAETLWGHQKLFTCAECGHTFPVNANDEVEPRKEMTAVQVRGYTCPNCAYCSDVGDSIAGRPMREIPSANSGDRVLVFKPQYHIAEPNRFDVPVFKYPESPQTDFIAMNYIKRLIGKPGETIAISRGDVYATKDLVYPADERLESGRLRFPRPDRELDIWTKDYTYPQSYNDDELLSKHQFQILRKPPVKMLALSRLVYDNDHQAKSMMGKGRPRWFPDQAAQWAMDDAKAPKRFAAQSTDLTWLRYQHLLPDWEHNEPAKQPSLITNFMGYNAGYNSSDDTPTKRRKPGPLDWVADLMLECDVEVGVMAKEMIMELSKSVDRFQVKFDITNGKCSLIRVRPTGPEVLATIDSSMKSAGNYRLRFANYDDQLTVWVNGSVLDFGDASKYPAVPAPLEFDPEDTVPHLGWVRANDLMQPASIGINGPIAVTHLRLLRDTYYLSNSKVDTYYVQPGHYFCLGDNSAQSADSRTWGLVPERLLLGRALMVYWPPARFGLIK